MRTGFIGSIRELLEENDNNRNLKINAALTTLRKEVAALFAIKNTDTEASYNIESLFSEAFNKCHEELKFETKVDITLYDYFKNGGYITRTIKSSDLLKELASRDPVSKRVIYSVPYNGVGVSKMFNQFVRDIHTDFNKHHPTVFKDGDLCKLKLTQLKNGIYLVNDKPTLVVYKVSETGKDTYPDYVLTITESTFNIYFHHPIEDVWIAHDGTAFFEGLPESINSEYMRVIDEACPPKKTFSFNEEISKLTQRAINIVKDRKFLPSLCTDQNKLVHYRANTDSFVGTDIQDSISFYFYTRDTTTQLSINVIGSAEPKYNTHLVYMISSIPEHTVTHSIEAKSIPLQERKQIISAANQTLTAIEYQIQRNKPTVTKSIF